MESVSPRGVQMGRQSPSIGERSHLAVLKIFYYYLDFLIHVVAGKSMIHSLTIDPTRRNQ